MCETNEGSMSKLASLPSLCGRFQRNTLLFFQDKAVLCHFKAIKEVPVNNLGHELSYLFLSFDEKPIAAASNAQVHRAVLKDDQEVVIKVQYLGLEKQMKIDIATMAFLSKSIS